VSRTIAAGPLNHTVQLETYQPTRRVSGEMVDGRIGNIFRCIFGEVSMNFTDRILKCCDCESDFIFTAGEQVFFHDKQFKNDPKRCKPCKAKRAAGPIKEGDTATVSMRTETRTVCSSCNAETTVPFKPTQGRPVLCRLCFQQKKSPMSVEMRPPEIQHQIQA